MNDMVNSSSPNLGGIQINGATTKNIEVAQQAFLIHLETLCIDRCVKTYKPEASSHSIGFQLHEDLAREWAPGHDTTELCRELNLDTQGDPSDLEREILLTMLLGPVTFQFPSYDELASAVRIRKNIVEAARKTMLAFDTEEAERPADYWIYSEEQGFTILPGKSLITALERATQPGAAGGLYSFSCYRATEYVILLAIAAELAICNSALFCQLENQWQVRAIKSGEFHDVFLREHGSMKTPLPPKYYVPGDRLWFRNPDRHSSDVKGYEGSWVFYLGGGLFTNFWQRDRPYTLTTKCVEIFHWRHATYRDQAGNLRMDEAIVDRYVRASMNDPTAVEKILQKMMRLREPSEVYVDGGCLDASREYPRCVHPSTADLKLPGT